MKLTYSKTQKENTTYLQGIAAWVYGKPAKDFKVGEIMLWNGGSESKVIGFGIETKSFITVKLLCPDYLGKWENAKVYDRKLKKDRIVATYNDFLNSDPNTNELSKKEFCTDNTNKNLLTTSNIKSNILIQEIKYPEFGTWKILRKYDNGIWEIRGDSGEKVLFESELNNYEIVKDLSIPEIQSMPEWAQDLYLDASGNCFSDADPGL